MKTDTIKKLETLLQADDIVVTHLGADVYKHLGNLILTGHIKTADEAVGVSVHIFAAIAQLLADNKIAILNKETHDNTQG